MSSVEARGAINRAVVVGLIVSLLPSCSNVVPLPRETLTTSPTSATSSTTPWFSSTPSGTGPTATATATPITTPAGPTVDASTLDGKVLFGYQGWFGCAGDHSPVDEWRHWFNDFRSPTADHLTVDLWPDTSELGAAELCPTSMTLTDGSPLMAYSAYNAATVMRHFEWMRDYGIDGIALQRFVGEVQDPRFFDFRNRVAQNVRGGAEATGRVFYLEFDVSGVPGADLYAELTRDWNYVVDVLRLTDSPQYLRHNGKPVVEIWGLGIPGSSGASAAQAASLVDFFRPTADDGYAATVIGGVGSYWRTGDRDAMGGKEWADVYQSFDVINPWAVGRYRNRSEADGYRDEVVAPDLAQTERRGVGYMPVVFPGFSWRNLFPDSPRNEIPRDCGRFYWRQVYNAISAGTKTIFVAMFDEVDEGTAMYKLVPTSGGLPEGSGLVPLDIDGCDLPSDWYLRLGGETGKALRGEIRLKTALPIQP